MTEYVGPESYQCYVMDSQVRIYSRPYTTISIKHDQGRIQRRGHATHYVPYPTYSSDFVSETGYAKNRIQYTDVNMWAVLFTEL